jgi:hypothetical protein
MRTIKVKPVEITGECQANLTLEDEFQIRGVILENPRQSNLCLIALSHLPPIVTQLQRETRCFTHFTCPDCMSHLEPEMRVVFLLGHADKWDLCQVRSAYDRLCGECDEPELARRLKEEALYHQDQGEYPQALHKMTAALEALERAFPKQEV